MSVSIVLRPASKKKMYRAWVVRADKQIPVPVDVTDMQSLRGFSVYPGEEELLAGDAVIVAEQVSLKFRSWDFSVAVALPDDSLVSPTSFGEAKKVMKREGIDPILLCGSGELAACVRFIWAIRLGMKDSLVATDVAWTRTSW